MSSIEDHAGLSDVAVAYHRAVDRHCVFTGLKVVAFGTGNVIFRVGMTVKCYYVLYVGVRSIVIVVTVTRCLRSASDCVFASLVILCPVDEVTWHGVHRGGPLTLRWVGGFKAF